jgi:hypothetical protein
MSVPYDNQVLVGKKTITATTYSEDEILIPTVPEGILPAFLRVEVEREKTDYLDGVGDYFGWHLSPKSQDDLIQCGEPDQIAGNHMESKGVGLEVDQIKDVYDFPAPMKISYKKIYIGFKGTHAGTIHYRIHWVPRPSKVPQRDNLVSQLQF